MPRALVIAVAMLLGSACQKGRSPEGPPVGAGFDERQACTTDADCAVVEIECCDHCNGGTVVAVDRNSAADVRTEYAGPDRCKETMCTQMACGTPVPICRQQRCGTSLDGVESMTPLPRP
jgi:hypothetical protein